MDDKCKKTQMKRKERKVQVRLGMKGTTNEEQGNKEEVKKASQTTMCSNVRRG